jgi:hypothetical protein
MRNLYTPQKQGNGRKQVQRAFEMGKENTGGTLDPPLHMRYIVRAIQRKTAFVVGAACCAPTGTFIDQSRQMRWQQRYGYDAFSGLRAVAA